MNKILGLLIAFTSVATLAFENKIHIKAKAPSGDYYEMDATFTQSNYPYVGDIVAHIYGHEEPCTGYYIIDWPHNEARINFSDCQNDSFNLQMSFAQYGKLFFDGTPIKVTMHGAIQYYSAPMATEMTIIKAKNEEE